MPCIRIHTWCISTQEETKNVKVAHTIEGAMPKKVEASSEAGKRLVRARRAKGMTQVQLAEAIGSSQRAISHYETMAEFPPTAVLVELAKVLGVSADYILNLKTPKAAPALEFPDPKTKKLWKKFQHLQRLPEKDQRAVIRLINSLISVTKAA